MENDVFIARKPYILYKKENKYLPLALPVCMAKLIWPK